MSRTDTWMPLYVGDYLADTMHLDAAEHGAYLLLLMNYWRTGPLPNDDKALSSVARVSRTSWAGGIGATVKAFFSLEDDGKLHQKRMDVERKNAMDLSVKKRAAASKRWAAKDGEKVPTGDAGGNPPADAPASPDASPLDVQTACPYAGVLPSPSPSKEERPEASLLPDIHLPVVDIRAELWAEGLPILRALTGKPEGPARALLGKLVQSSRDDCARVLAALQEARDMRPVDPIPWLQRAVVASRALTPMEQVLARVNAKSEEVPTWMLQ